MTRRVDELLLLTAQTIRLDYGGGEIAIKQPTINQIAEVGEAVFFQALGLFTLSPEPMKGFISEIEGIEESFRKEWIEQITTYDYLLFLINASGENENEIDVRMLLSMVFDLIIPHYHFIVTRDSSAMFLVSIDAEKPRIEIDRDLFTCLSEVVSEMFVLDYFFQEVQEVERSAHAQEIADKMAASEEKVARIQGESKKGSYLTRVLSIMGVRKELNYLSSLTVYQLYNQFERHNLYEMHQQSVQAALAGATIDESVDWYKTI